MPPLKRSCLPIVDRGYCLDLKTCCQVLGWLQVVGSTRIIVSAIRDEDYASVLALYQYAATKDAKPSDDVIRAAASAIVAGISLIKHVIFLVAAILFLVGISKGEPRKMVHYIRLTWVEIFCWSICLIALAVYARPVYLIGFAYIGVAVYSLICANSLHIQMMAGQYYSHEMSPIWFQLIKCMFAMMLFSNRPSISLYRSTFDRLFP